MKLNIPTGKRWEMTTAQWTKRGRFLGWFDEGGKRTHYQKGMDIRRGTTPTALLETLNAKLRTQNQ